MTSDITFIYVPPVPASRPRVPRYGKPFYVGKYKAYREQMDEWLRERILCYELLTSPLYCDVEFVVKRPRNPANSYPIGDIDNYLKAIWDVLQGRAFFKDDKQIEAVDATKRYTMPDEKPHTRIFFEEH